MNVKNGLIVLFIIVTISYISSCSLLTTRVVVKDKIPMSWADKAVISKLSGNYKGNIDKICKSYIFDVFMLINSIENNNVENHYIKELGR